jgi:muramoyltetrapeptide carboxypeptidase
MQCLRASSAPPVWDFSIEQSLDYYFAKCNYPSFSGLMIGHTDNQLTLPIGINAEIDANNGSVKILENTVE